MTQVQSAMQAMVLGSRGAMLEPSSVPVPRPGPNEVLIRVGACGLGLTVRDKLWRIDANQLPRIPGHEIVGTVAEVGANVLSVTPGERVVAYYYDSCGHCVNCRSGRESICLDRPRRIGEHIDGGFAEFACIPESTVIPVDVRHEEVSDVELTVACDALGTSLHAMRRAGVGGGSRVLIVGAAGGVGLHLLQVVHRAGGSVVGVDIGSEKLSVLSEAGCEPIDASDPAWADRLTASVDVAVDLVGDDHSMTSAYRALAPGGSLIRMVTYRKIQLRGIIQSLGAEERTISGSRYCSKSEVREAVDLIATGAVRAVIGAAVPLESANELIEMLDRRQLLGRGAVIP